MIDFYQNSLFAKRPFMLYALSIIAVFYFFAALASDGWLSADEHFQILEFANYKRGLLDEKYLAWEFTDRIRPALQPLIAYVLLNTMSFVGLKDPFNQAIVLRLISSGLFLFSSWLLFTSLRRRFAEPFYHYSYFFATFLLYCLPLFAIRFLSENWSACFLILALAVFCKYEKGNDKLIITESRSWITGILLGLSFLFRYQSGIMIFGLSLWLLIFHFRAIKSWIRMFVGFAAVCLVGILIDRWFYGEWVLSAWNYFYVNLVESKAASFGVSPWWWYFEELIVGRWLSVLNVLLMLLLVIFGLRNYKHPFTWLFFSFLFVHMLISHKELRFIYPMLVLVPFMIIDSLHFVESILKKKVMYALVSILVLINSFSFIAMAFRVHDNTAQIFKFIRQLPDQPVVVYSQGENFYYTLADDPKSLSPRFYKDGHDILRKELEANSVELETNRSAKGDTLVYFVLDQFDANVANPRLKMVYDTQPAWLLKLNYRNWMHKSSGNWKVYEVDGAN
jgi:phosphatidylinositol glycan class B